MFGLDMGDLYEFMPIGAFFVWSFVIVPILPPELRPLGPVGMVIPIVFMIVLEQTLKWMASEYLHILAHCRPSNIELDLFITSIETREIQPGLFSSKLSLGQIVKHPYYQLMEYLVIKHWGTWEDRMEFCQRKVKFKHEEITHNKSAVVTLYEEQTSDVDHLKPIPVFVMVEAPRDYYNPQDYYREVVAPMLEANGGQLMQALTQEQRFDIEKLQSRNMELEGKVVEYERQAMYWHNLAVKGEQVIKQLKNELHAVLSSASDQMQAVIEILLMWLGAHVDIREALKAARGPYAWLNKKVIFGALALVGILMFILNPDPIMQWLQMKEIQAFLLILAVIAGIVYYQTQRR